MTAKLKDAIERVRDEIAVNPPPESLLADLTALLDAAEERDRLRREVTELRGQLIDKMHQQNTLAQQLDGLRESNTALRKEIREFSMTHVRLPS